MSRRVFLCLADPALAAGVRDGLLARGAEAERVERGALPAAGGLAGGLVVVQDVYPDATSGSSLLGQLQDPNGGSLPAVCVATRPVPPPERLEMERRYHVKAFADAQWDADDVAELVFSCLPEEAQPNLAPSPAWPGALPEDPVSQDLDWPDLAPVPELDDLSTPLPELSGDFDLPASLDLGWDVPDPPEAEPPALPAQVSSSPQAANPHERDEAMQIEELEKALLAETHARESAEQRIAELEVRLQAAHPMARGADDGVPAEGRFEETRYPLLLALCRAEFYSGALRFKVGGSNTRTVYMRNGLPTAYSSSEPGERIGRTMVAQGRITDEQYIKAATVMVERGIRLADALVELGFIDADTLALEMRNLTRDQILQGFELTQGRFTTHTDIRPEPGIATFEFSPGEIYMQGFRRYGPAQEMAGLYETLRDTYLVASTRLASFRPQLGLGGEDERLLRLLGEAYTLEEAVERAGVSSDHAARLLAALQALGLVEEWSPGVEQFRNRLRTEMQRHAEEVASLREEMSRREQRLFEGFERALAKIGTGAGAEVSVAAQLAPREARRQLEASTPPRETEASAQLEEPIEPTKAQADVATKALDAPSAPDAAKSATALQPALEDSAVDDSAVEDSAMDDSAVDDSAMDDSAVDDSAVDDSAVDDSAVDDSATAEHAAEDAAALGSWDVAGDETLLSEGEIEAEAQGDDALVLAEVSEDPDAGMLGLDAHTEDSFVMDHDLDDESLLSDASPAGDAALDAALDARGGESGEPLVEAPLANVASGSATAAEAESHPLFGPQSLAARSFGVGSAAAGAYSARPFGSVSLGAPVTATTGAATTGAAATGSAATGAAATGSATTGAAATGSATTGATVPGTGGAGQALSASPFRTGSAAASSGLETPSSDASPAAPAAGQGADVQAPAPASDAPSRNAFGILLAGELSPADAKYRQGVEWAGDGKWDEAEATLREAVRVDASKPHYLVSLAKVLLANPRYERSGTLPVVRSLVDRAAKIAPDDTEVAAFRTQVIGEMGT